jgi:transcription elongation factor GreB
MDDDEAPRLTLDGKFYMTPTGHAQLREELVTLMNVERPRVVNVVSWAAANGDRSENADYQYGKRRLSEIDRRARFLVKRIEDAIVVEPSRQLDRDRVFFGATVAYVGAFEGERAVTIVGVDEADMRMGKISLTAPIATALIKARARRGDEVAVHTPRGVEIIEVLSVSYPSPAAPYEDAETMGPVGSVSEPVDHRTEQCATRCQVLGETNSGCKLRGGRDWLRPNLEPHQCSSNISLRSACRHRRAVRINTSTNGGQHQ